MAKINHTPVGSKFGRWTVISEPFKKSTYTFYVQCRCECGTEASVVRQNLHRGFSKSCGCLCSELTTKSHLTHGMSHTKTYTAYMRMISRCTNKNNKDFKDYGGRGIKVCDRWRAGFEFFLQDMGERPDKMSIERNDVNGDYEPSNCRWATNEEQANNRRSNVFLEHLGRRMTIAQWARENEVSETCITLRLKRGWSIERALTEPSRPTR